MTAIVLAQLPQPEVVRQTTEDVLGQADYAVTRGPSLLDRALGYLLEQLGRFLLRFGGDGGEGSTLAALALVLVLVAILVGLGVFVARLRRSRTLDPVVEGPVGRSAVDWAAEAQQHEDAGELRQALRCRYRETLAGLAAAQLVEEIPGRTTGEYAHEVGVAVPAADGPFAALTRVFEDTWYGGRDVDAALLGDVRQAQRDVATAAGTRRSPVGAGG